MAAPDQDKPTELFPPADPEVLYIIDISGYVFRAYHALPPLSSPAGEPTHAVLGVTTMLLKLLGQQSPARLAVAMDSRTKSFRHGIYDGYKANRPPAPEDLKQQMTRVREVVDAYGIPVFQQDGVEADDMIATVVRHALQAQQRVVIVSADKDLLQLVSDRVLMYDTGRNKVFGVPETKQKLGVEPGQVRDYLALVGDTSDNVPGVPSVGPKTAVKLLSTFGELDALYARLDEVDKPQLRKKLETHREQALLSQELVTLKDDVEVEFSLDALQNRQANQGALRQLFTDLGFSRLLAQLDAAGTAEAASEGAAPATNSEGLQEIQGPVTLVDSQEQLQVLVKALQQAQAAGSELGLYCVSDGVRPLGEDQVGLGLWSNSEVFYVPLRHPEPGLERAEVFEALAPFLNVAGFAKWTLEAKREYLAYGGHGVTLQGVGFDVGLASYLLDPDRSGHSLAEVWQGYFGSTLPAQAQWTKRGAKDAAPSARSASELAAGVGLLLRAASVCLQRQRADLPAERAALLQDMELPLSRVLATMELVGVRVDVERLQQLSEEASGALTELEQRCIALAGHEFNVAAPRQLETILFDELQLPVIKRTKTARSTDQSVLEELAVMHELPAAILEHRMLAKLKSTYLDALPKEVRETTGRIHSDFRQTVAATGRLSSSDPNLQNIPIRRDFGRRIRSAFVPADGWQMMSADYSQIELRVLAHMSADEALLSAFRSGEDVHVRTAQAIFGVPADEVTPEMRGQAKTVNFAVIYGQTQFALARNLRIERPQAARYIKAFFAQYSGVQQYMTQVVEEGRETGYVATLCGRLRFLPDLRSKNHVKRQAAERIARNAPIQGTAADIIKRAMLAVAEQMAEQQLQSRMLLTVHDELVFEAPTQEREALTTLVRSCMENALPLDVPLLVESGWGASWDEAH